MAIKKYSLVKMLLEYNEEYGTDCELSSHIVDATIIYHIEKSYFEYSPFPPYTHKLSFPDFLFENVNRLPVSKFLHFVQRRHGRSIKSKIEIWPSSKIRYAYLQTNYFSGGGQLGKSCMRDKNMQKSLNFYVKNKVKIVVVIDGNNKVHARALLWDNVKTTRSKDVFTYLDRVYANSELIVSLFYELAKENGWKYYKSTSAGEGSSHYYKDDINITGICYLPYTDTFRRLYYTSKPVIISGGPLGKAYDVSGLTYLTLTNTTNGGYFPALDPNRVKEALTGNTISKKDAVFVKKYKGYVSKKNIVDIRGTYYSTYDKEITQSQLDGFILAKDSIDEALTSNSMDKTKAVYSAKYDGYIHKSNAVYIEDGVYHKSDNNIIYFDNKWYHISQCFINYDRKVVNEELAKGLLYSPEDFMPYWARSAAWDSRDGKSGITRKGDLIPKEHAIIAYDIIYNPMLNDIVYQEVYCTIRDNLIQLITGEFVVNSISNKKHIKRFNGKYYIKKAFKLPNKNQLLLFK